MFWKAYVRLLAGFFILINVGTVVGWQAAAISGPVDVLDRALMLLSLAGLYGYAWRKQVLPRRFWQVYVPVAIAWDIAYSVFFETPTIITRANLPELILVAPFVLPLYYALIRFAYGRSVAPRAGIAQTPGDVPETRLSES